MVRQGPRKHLKEVVDQNKTLLGVVNCETL